MDENTWRFAQVIMWLIGTQTAFLTGLIGLAWNNLSKRIDKVEKRIDKIEDRIKFIENDLIEIKTVLRLKECCMIKDERKIERAE